jgi:DNA-binding response OmpR family regulator
MRILLVEDDLQLGPTFQRTLENEGYLTKWVTSVELAEIALTESEFDLMILDWTLPKLSGVFFLRKLRLEACNMPILRLTARLGTELKVIGLVDTSVDDYLTKPFNLDELLAKVRYLIQSRRMRPDLVLRTFSESVLYK